MALSLQRYMRPDVFDSPFVQLSKERDKIEREISIGIAIPNQICFHESVVVEILSWLPVKDLMRYKSVCKLWYAIISSPGFGSKHLKNYYQNNQVWRGCLLIRYESYAFTWWFAVLVDETPRVIADEELPDMPMETPEICGPCDGLYFLGHEDGIHAIWNPVMNELKVLPPIITKYDPYLWTSSNPGFGYSGFGFDPISRDYKVVVVKCHWDYVAGSPQGNEHPQSVLVYSLRNDSWRYCGDLRRYYQFDDTRCYNCVNGCCYWLESDYVYEYGKTYEAIISFDLALEAFDEINLPEYTKPASKCLGLYDETLALLSFNKNDKALEIWTLKEGIWSLKLRTRPLEGVENPVGHWKDNKILLDSEGGNLHLLDPDSQTIKDLGYNGGGYCREIFAYEESLVSVNGVASWNYSTGPMPAEDHSVREIISETSESDSELGIHELFGDE